MSSVSAPKSLALRGVQAMALAAVFAMAFATSRMLVNAPAAATVTAVGFLLLAGVLASELCEMVGLPHLSGYLLAGIVAGPHVLHLVQHDTVEALTKVNKLALSLIALAGGAELRLEDLKQGMKGLAYATLFQSTLALLLCMGTFFLVAPYLPFLNGFSLPALIGAAGLWGVLAVTRSPAALLGILSQTRAQGPLTRFSLAFIMSSDVVVIVLLAFAFMFVRPVLIPGATFALSDLVAAGHEILGSVAIGTTFGLVLVGYLKLIGRALIVVLVALGFGLSEVLGYLHFDPLLVFIIGGLVVQNLSKQADKLLHAVEETGSVVYVVFFATAGAHLDLPLLARLWPVAVALAAARVLATYVSHHLACRLAGDPPVLVKYGWTSLVSQAGLALGLAGVVSAAFPAIGLPFQSLAIAVVAINEMVGPVLFKWALDRAGETRSAH
jgi:Kef-type K+ transport system membrane component KefB